MSEKRKLANADEVDGACQSAGGKSQILILPVDLRSHLCKFFARWYWFLQPFLILSRKGE